MRKMNDGRGFPVEAIVRAVMNCRPARTVGSKIRNYLGRMEARRTQTICVALIAAMLVGEVVLLFRTRDHSRASPPYSLIRPVTTAGAERRSATVKSFGQAWDSLMADSMRKKQWDSLLRLRPGLRDTMRQLERMDSAVWGR